MKPILSFALPWLALLATAPTPPPSPAVLVEHERAFARTVAEQSVRAGFLEWLAPRSVVFQPGPVDGRKRYEAAKPGPAVLAWEPAYAAISRDGDLGWTTGPWSWRSGKDAEPVAWGEYLSVWKRQEGGGYKVVLDGGIEHGKPDGAPGEPVHLSPAEAPRAGRGPLDRRRSLWKADADFGALAKQGGVAIALEKYAADGVVLLRDGVPRVAGRAAACDTVRAREGSATLMSLAQFLAESGDLGYTYGSFVTGETGAPDSAYYVHVWHRGAAKPWELAAEVVMPVPKPGK